jgi:hypothetical protein
VALDLDTNQETKIWLDGEKDLKPPFDFDQCTMVAFYALAELSCFHALGWPLPKYVLDLYTEFKNHVNGTHHDKELGLLACLKFFENGNAKFDHK